MTIASYLRTEAPTGGQNDARDLGGNHEGHDKDELRSRGQGEGGKRGQQGTHEAKAAGALGDGSVAAVEGHEDNDEAGDHHDEGASDVVVGRNVRRWFVHFGIHAHPDPYSHQNHSKALQPSSSQSSETGKTLAEREREAEFVI